MPNRIPTACLLTLVFIILNFAVKQLDAAPLRTADATASRLITRIPFTLLSGGIIVLKARLDSFPDTLNFVFDTGSGGISLDSVTVDEYKLPVTPSQRLLRGVGSLRKISYVTKRTLHLPRLDVENLDFHINDYTLLTSVYGMKIDGIMGFSFLNRYIVKVDYDQHILEVWTPGVIKLPKGGFTMKPVINGIPVFDALLTDGASRSSNFYFDTGAGLCLLLSQAYVRDSSILPPNRKTMPTQAEGLSGKEPMKLSILNQVKIGQYKFKKVPVHIFDDEYNVTAYPYLGGLIGNDLLRRFNLVINYSQNIIHLKPNSHFGESFDYSYTGLGIYDIDSKIVIEDVLPGSPGEKAGLKPGDIIVAIDNNFKQNIQAYKNLLQRVGAKLKIIVMRDNVPLVLTLKVASII